MLPRSFVTAAALALAAPAVAQTAPPKLVIAISVDQLSTDLFTEYRPQFDGGLKRMSDGVAFPAGYQGHAATETCPGHSTILTGSRPARTGIIANRWFDLTLSRDDKRVYCAEDVTVAGSSSSKYTASPVHLRVPTLGERMKAADPRSRSVSVAGKDRAALMMGGKIVDQMWWLGAEGFTGPAAQIAQPVVAQVNASLAAALAQPRAAMALPAHCEAKARAVQVGAQSVGDGRFARDAGDANRFRTSPESDAATLALAAALIEQMKLGQGAATDVIAIGLSATDYVGHAYGTAGGEMCLQLSTLDADLGAFFERMGASGIDYVAMLTADHGGHDTPERHRQHAAPDAARAEPALEAAAMSAAIGAKLGLKGQLLYADGPFGDFYISREITPAQRARVLAEAKAYLSAHPQVAAVFDRAQLAAAPTPTGSPDNWSLLERATAGFDPQRSGDFVLLLKPRITPIPKPGPGYIATHGSPHDYDRRVPVLFWRKGMTSFEQPLAVETADILPTLAALIGLSVPAAEIDGRCLDLDASAASSCR